MTRSVLRLESSGKVETADPDDALIARVVARDEAAFSILGTRYSGLVFSIAFRMLGTRAAAEDVVQDVLLKLWTRAGDWDCARGASVKTWICRITANACIDIRRKRGREISGDIPETIAPDAGADTAAATRETGKIVAQALQTLPERQRMAILMFHYEGLSVAEIGAALEISPKAAEGLLTRGRISLKETLGKLRNDL